MVKIGLETHVQLDTETKLFCGCPNREAEKPNTHVCETCLGHPGSKPGVNEEVIDQALKTSIALQCSVNDEYFFSRKTYFYPDMSKNYQITQYELPVGEDGEFQLNIGDEKKDIGIIRLHIEEDPAKLVHEGGSVNRSDYTKIDYNRAGTPLLEIVTEPDLETPKEARAYLQQLSQMLEYLGIYEPDSNRAIKSDANISIDGGERIEVKNITGTSAIEKALNYEISRQKQLKKRGKKVTQQTRSFNADMGATEKMREKETEEDYGYIFDPDLTRQETTKNDVKNAEASIPELPHEKFERYTEEGLKDKMAEALISDPEIVKLFEDLKEEHGTFEVASLLTGELKKVLNYHDLDYTDSGLEKEWISQLLEFLEEDSISDRNAEQLLREAVEDPRPFNRIAEEEDLLKSGEDYTRVVEEVIENEGEAVEDYRNGDEEALNYLVGQVMASSNGKADPKKAREKILERLE
ncbi:MAG: Asp-tRNA(Asn)/Glu-tRNA(Gln) amidotransferase subunit GatB [Candidatus Nanohaloarchaea archaeon]